MPKQDISLLDETSLAGLIDNQPAYRIHQVFQWLWTKEISSFDEFTNLPKPLRRELDERFYLPVLTVKSQQTAGDRTIKVVFKLGDGQMIEGVLIPDGKRVTACISSQVGCNVGCRFCATGKMGFFRNLSVGEIVFQVKKLNLLAGENYDNHLSSIVFMGMGEPLLNYKNVMRASTILTTKEGLGMSPQRITMSTVGIADKIVQMANEGIKFNLAVSLHTASEKTRSALIPINRTFPIEKLQAAIKHFHSKTGNRITIEYLLMKGINDTEKDARILTEFTKAFPCKINVIEYNPVTGIPFQRTEKKHFNEFISFLKSKNLIVMVRRSRGKDINAACGQLAIQYTTTEKR